MKKKQVTCLAAIGVLVMVLLALVSGSGQAQTTILPSASQVASQIEIGWNLGNTLEAICSETAWGNPMVTQDFIDSVKAAGFNAVRIPAAWDCHADQSTLEIDPAWMARVKEVVDYAINSDMYVILNIHWDNGWLEEHPLYAYQEEVNQKQDAYWTQIANYFRAYDEHLLFAGTNEVHADYGEPTTEHITVQQSYLQTFVDAVRATGGNNASRTLVVQTYNTNMWHGLNYFTIPTDTISDRLIVEVHYYDPYDYTLNESGSCLYWGEPYPTQSACTWADEDYVDDLFAQVRAEWVDAGIPVIIGEYGVATRPNLNLESREYYLWYINQAAAQNGIKTFYWDNGVSPNQSNGFALFDRNTGAVIDPGALDAVLGSIGPTPTPTGPSPTPTQSPTAMPTPGGATCEVDYTVSNDWGSGATISVDVINNANSAIDGWTLEWSFPGDQQITNLWGGSYTQNEAEVEVTNDDWNATIPANGGSVNVGFNVVYSGSNEPPGQFVLNGVVCGDEPVPTPTPTQVPTATPTEAPTATPTLSPAERGCIESGGVVETSMCCLSTGDFPNMCLPGPCGCAPDQSHQVKVCDCGAGMCFDGEQCVAVPTPPGPTVTPTEGPTATPTEPPTATPTPSGTTCTVDYTIGNDWGSGATVSVDVINHGSTAVDGWTLEWTFPGDQQITNLWNGTYAQSGSAVEVTDLGWNGTIPADGGLVSVGFNLTYSGSNDVPTGFILNGESCQVD